MVEKRIGVHELYTPLHAIDGAVELLLDGSLQNLSHETREIISLIARSSRDLADKISLLTDIAELANADRPYLAKHKIRHLLEFCGFNAVCDQAMTGEIEVDTAHAKKAVVLMDERLGATMTSVQVDDGSLFMEFRVAGQDMASGDGSLALVLAKLLVEQSGGRLLDTENQRISVTFPLIKT